MIRIIDGVRYDTSKAELQVTGRTWVGPGDDCWGPMNLYRTKKGRWFFETHDGLYPEELEGVWVWLQEESERRDDDELLETMRVFFPERWAALEEA